MSDASDAPVDAATCTPACGAGKACVSGACMNAPVVLARAPGCGAARLALWDGYVYWTEQATGTVKRLAVVQPGGPPKVMATGQMKPGPIAVDDLNVYWSNDGDLTIRTTTHELTAATGGDASPPLLTAPAVVRGVAADGGFLYYSAGTGTFRVAITGGAPLTLAAFPACKMSLPVALAPGGGYVYQTDQYNQFITRELDDGTQAVNDPCASADAGAPKIAAPETITHSQGELYLDALYVVGDEVAWADHTNVNAKVVTGAAVSGRPVAVTASSNPITGFVVTNGAVYLGESGDPSTGAPDAVEVAAFGASSAPAADADVDTPTATFVALGQPNASSFAADATNVYWTTHAPSATAGAPDDCAIVSLAK